MKNPLVSIIVPYYNGKKYLDQLFDTTLNQTYKNIEVLILNDFSTDDSINIINEKIKEDSRLRLIDMPQKGGCGSKGVEEGLKHVYGEYFFIMTQDDFLDKDYIEKCVDQINKTGVKIVLTKSYFHFGQTNKQIGKTLKKEIAGKKAFELSLNWKISNVSLRSVELTKIEPFVTTCYDMDEYLFKKYLLLVDKVAFADTAFYYRVDNPNSLSKELHYFNFETIKSNILLVKTLIENKFSVNSIDKHCKELIKIYQVWFNVYKINKPIFSKEHQEYIENIFKFSKEEIEAIIKKYNLIRCKYKLLFSKLEDVQSINYKTPLVSIIVPHYNGKKYLEQLFDTTLNQTYKNIELLLVDDFSTDNESLEIIKRQREKDSRVRLIPMPKKGGYGNFGVEEGLKHVKGEYFTVLTQDDFLDKDYVEKCVEQINKTGAEIVLSRAHYFKGEGKKRRQIGKNFKHPISGKKAFALGLDWEISNHGLRSVKLLEKDPFVCKYYNQDEYQFRKWLLLVDKVAFADTAFYYTVNNPDALTKSVYPFNFDILETQLFHIDLLQEYKFPKHVIEKRINKLIKQHNKIWVKAFYEVKDKYSKEDVEYVRKKINNEVHYIKNIVKDRNLVTSKIKLLFTKLEEV